MAFRELVINTTDFSVTVGTTPISVFANGELGNIPLTYMRIYNVSASATIWLSRSGRPAAPFTAGSFPLTAGQYELWAQPQNIPGNVLSIVSSAANTPVTIEVG